MDDDAVKDYFLSLDLSSADALCIFDLFDEASEIGVHVDDFVLGCLRLKGWARSSDMIRLLFDQRQLKETLKNISDHLRVDEQRTSQQHVVDRNLFMEQAIVDIQRESLKQPSGSRPSNEMSQ